MALVITSLPTDGRGARETIPLPIKDEVPPVSPIEFLFKNDPSGLVVTSLQMFMFPQFDTLSWGKYFYLSAFGMCDNYCLRPVAL